MLTPDYIDSLSNRAIMDLYERYTQSIINDIARRLNKGAFASAAWQVERLSESGLVYETALSQIAQLTGKTQKELKKIFKEAGVQTLKFDDAIYKKAGFNPGQLNMSPAMLQVLSAGLLRTNGLMQNLAKTTALSAQNSFIRAGDIANLQVLSGALDYDTAIRRAIKTVSQQGLQVIAYPGKTDLLDVAMRRAVLTGVSQTTGKIQEIRADQLGVDLVQVSAHAGSRPTHALWQGKIFSRSGSSSKYPAFVESTGYGTVTGLMGANCRHSWYPFFEGISENIYDKATANQMDKKMVTYNGKQMTLYDAQQTQRSMERSIRQVKREATALNTIGLDNTTELIKVRDLQARMRDFIRQTGLDRQYVREGGRVVNELKSGVRASVQINKQPVIKEDTTTQYKKGMFESKLVDIEGDGKGILKSNKSTIGQGQKEDIFEGFARNEVAAYDLDTALGLGVVPETVPWVNEQGEFFSLQKWIDKLTSDRDIQGGYQLPDRYKDLAKRTQPGHMSLLDMLTGNQDRFIGGNYGMDVAGNIKAIDNGLGFLTDQHSLSINGFMHDEARMKLRGFTQSFDLKEIKPRFFVDKEVRTRLESMLDSGELEKMLRSPVYQFNEGQIKGVLGRAQDVLDGWSNYFVDDIAEEVKAPVKKTKKTKAVASLGDELSVKHKEMLQDAMQAVLKEGDIPLEDVFIGQAKIVRKSQAADMGPAYKRVLSRLLRLQDQRAIKGLRGIYFVDDEASWKELLKKYNLDRNDGKLTVGFFEKKSKTIYVPTYATLDPLVLTHEIAHNAYLHTNTGSKWAIRWVTDDSFDRHTWYAATHPEEGFAETYAAWVASGKSAAWDSFEVVRQVLGGIK